MKKAFESGSTGFRYLGNYPLLAIFANIRYQ